MEEKADMIRLMTDAIERLKRLQDLLSPKGMFSPDVYSDEWVEKAKELRHVTSLVEGSLGAHIRRASGLRR